MPIVTLPAGRPPIASFGVKAYPLAISSSQTAIRPRQVLVLLFLFTKQEDIEATRAGGESLDRDERALWPRLGRTQRVCHRREA
jgi:hypothetical protein